MKTILRYLLRPKYWSHNYKFLHISPKDTKDGCENMFEVRVKLEKMLIELFFKFVLLKCFLRNLAIKLCDPYMVTVSPSPSLVLENIGFVYPSMSMIKIGHSLIY
jgi:hypothetical protein